MNELLALKDKKLDKIYFNFSSIIRSNGRKFIIDILNYIDRVENCNDINELYNINLDLGKPIPIESDTNPIILPYASKESIEAYLTRKVTEVYVKYLENSHNFNNDFETMIYNNIVSFKSNNICESPILYKFIREKIEGIELL